MVLPSPGLHYGNPPGGIKQRRLHMPNVGVLRLYWAHTWDSHGTVDRANNLTMCFICTKNTAMETHATTVSLWVLWVQ